MYHFCHVVLLHRLPEKYRYVVVAVYISHFTTSTWNPTFILKICPRRQPGCPIEKLHTCTFDLTSSFIIFLYFDLSWLREDCDVLTHSREAENHAIISDKPQQRNIVSILTWYRKENRYCCNVFQRNPLHRTYVLVRRHQTRSFARTALVTWIIAYFHAVTFPIGSMGKTLSLC